MKRAAIILVLILSVGADAQISSQTVNRVWQKMLQADGLGSIPMHYENDDEPNAWVRWQNDGSFSFHVTRGLMQILKTESEIAGVLGHEIGHVKLGHYHNIMLTDAARTIMTVNLERTDDLSQAVGNIDIELRESSFSREQETDADDYGVSLLKRANYDSWGLYNAMKRFDSAGYETEHNGFNSHPASQERLAHLAEISGAERAAETKNLNDVDDIASAIMGR